MGKFTYIEVNLVKGIATIRKAKYAEEHPKFKQILALRNRLADRLSYRLEVNTPERILIRASEDEVLEILRSANHAPINP